MSIPPNGENNGISPESGQYPQDSQSVYEPSTSQAGYGQQPGQSQQPGQFCQPRQPKTLPLIGSAKSLLSDLAVAGISYAGVLLTSVLICLIIALAGGISAAQYLDNMGGTLGDLSDFSEYVDFNPLVFIGLVFQIAAIALGGVFTLNMRETASEAFLGDDYSSGMEASVDSAFLPLLATLVGITLVFFLSRKITQREVNRGQQVTVAGLWIRSAIMGLILGVLALIITLITAPRMSVEIYSSEAIKLTMSAVSFGLFFWPFLVGTLVSAGGRRSVVATPTALTDKLHLFLPGLKTASVITAIIMAVFSVAVGIVLFIYIIVESSFSSALAIMALTPGVALIGVGLSFLTGLSMKYGASDYGFDGQTSYIWDVIDAWSILAILCAIIAIVLIAFAWAGRRPRINTVGSWFVMPLVFLILGCIFNLLTVFSGSVRSGNSLMNAGAHLAGWTCLVMLIWGIIVELLARFVAPRLAGALPAGLRQKLMGQPRDPQFTQAFVASSNTGVTAPEYSNLGEPTGNAAEPDSSDAASVVAGATAAGAGTAGVSTAAYASSQPGASANNQPMSESAKKKLKIGLFSLLGVIVLIILGFVTVAILNATAFNPKNQVSSYMQSVQDGDVDGAVNAIDPNVSSEQRSLLNSDVLNAADKRISSYEIEDVEKSDDGESATANVKVTQDQKTSDLTLYLNRTGGMFGVDQWEIDSSQQGLYRTVDVYVPNGVTELTVNGTKVDIGEGSPQPTESSSYSYGYYGESSNEQMRTFTVLPGEYTFSAPEGSKYITYGDDQKALVNVESQSPSSIQFTQQLTDSVLEDAQAAAKEKLDQCATVKEFEVEDCGWDYYTSGDDYKNPSWSIEKYPEYELSNSSYGGYYSEESVDPNQTVYLVPSTRGEAKLTYQYKTFDDEWEDRDGEESISDSFKVSISGDELTLEKSDY